MQHIDETIKQEKARLDQLAQALEEHRAFILNTNARYQYLLATQEEIKNQIQNLETLTSKFNLTSKFKEAEK